MALGNGSQEPFWLDFAQENRFYPSPPYTMEFPTNSLSEEDFDRSDDNSRTSIVQGHSLHNRHIIPHILDNNSNIIGDQIRYGRAATYPSTDTDPSATFGSNWSYNAHNSSARVDPSSTPNFFGGGNFCYEPGTVQSQTYPESFDWSAENQFPCNASAVVTQPQYESHANIENIEAPSYARPEKQQFPCEHPDCGKSFTKLGDLKRHIESLHDPNPKVFVCGCCDEKVPHNWKRLDKLKDHKFNRHGHVRGSAIARCLECHGHDGREEVYFCSIDALEDHRGRVHRKQSTVVSPELSSNALKRGQETPGSMAGKRLQLQMSCKRPSEESSRDPLFESFGIHEHLVKLGYKIELMASSIEIFNVRVIDIMRLLRLEGSYGKERSVKRTDSGILCNIFNASIQIRRSDNLTTTLKQFYELCTAGPSWKNGFPFSLICFGTQSPETSSKSMLGPKIYVMRKVEDANVLAIWHQRVIPGLPDILRKHVGDTYSASLVRKGTSELSSIAEIRIQTCTVPAENVREHIREQVHKLVGLNSGIHCPRIKFSKGDLTKLAGSVVEDGDRNDTSDQDDGETGEDTIYPWNQRYWPNPGPGASIGLQCTKTVAATAGCLVNIGKHKEKQFILTVKHLITDSCQHEHGYPKTPATIVSPALLHVDDLKSKLTQFISNFELDLRKAWSNHRSNPDSDYFSPEEYFSLPQHIRDLIEAVAKTQEDLTHVQNSKALELGSLMYTNQDLHDVDHHLDWALICVNRDRTGTNRHRYPFNWEHGTVNYFADEGVSLCARPQFCETGVVEPNTKVHFVGQGTGRQSGEINAAQSLVSIDGRLSTEWGIVLDPHRQGDSNSHKGDSGATIIGDVSNKLLGLLWAWASGQLLFTDINIVFADIEQTVGSPVSLPSADMMPPPSALPITAQTISAIEPKEKVQPPQLQRRIRPRDVLGPRGAVKPPLASPQSPKTRLRQLSQTKEMVTHLDSLASSPSISAPSSTQRTTPSNALDPSQDSENKIALQYIVNNFHKTKTWPILQRGREKQPRQINGKRAKTIPFLGECNPRKILSAIDVN